jgi:hypothetical protein
MKIPLWIIVPVVSAAVVYLIAAFITYDLLWFDGTEPANVVARVNAACTWGGLSLIGIMLAHLPRVG